MAKIRHKIVPASYVVFTKDGRVLLARRANTGFMDGYYSLPAGHVEKGETFTQCCVREIKEEVGINLDPENLLVVHVMNRDSRVDYPQGVAEDINERIDIFFAVEKWEGEIKNMEPEKCDDISWFSFDDLPNNIIPYIKQALERINKKIIYSEFGFGDN